MGKNLTPAKIRRNKIVEILEESIEPVSASKLAEILEVSRQVIVGDIALLRAQGLNIAATPRGYLTTAEDDANDFAYIGIVACAHLLDKLEEELYTVVDYGGTVIDVTVEHMVYGAMTGELHISSRYDADIFIEKIKTEENTLLTRLTGGLHLHRIGCKDEETFRLIEQALTQKGICAEN